jgi:hypothetical protein
MRDGMIESIAACCVRSMAWPGDRERRQWIDGDWGEGWERTQGLNPTKGEAIAFRRAASNDCVECRPVIQEIDLATR